MWICPVVESPFKLVNMCVNMLGFDVMVGAVIERLNKDHPLSTPFV
jgi:hypothetical protein